ncbi:MAG TPA: CopG family antitoxin [Patescibacteria group bacterium]|nr:CopG family antitoxin [Patescibacteria group bacterium]
MIKKKIILDSQEKRIERALEKGDFVPSPDSREINKLIKEAAKNYQELSKTKRITIRVKQADLIKVKVKAKQNNIPYQRLLNALIRQFAEGRTLLRF